jgi:hypothetical protein
MLAARQAPPLFFSDFQRSFFWCCIAKPGKAILELLLAHQANRGDVQWTLNDSGAPGTLVQMSER